MRRVKIYNNKGKNLKCKYIFWLRFYLGQITEIGQIKLSV